ncbi:MAG: ABC transporter ATP-binding protein [Clostridia bacterium]|nr:ABC transporter ATP-binding protein [Clostridia bacterium]
MLEVKNLSAGYGERTIVSGVSLSVAAGEILTLIGPNGSGKSTLLKTLCGQLPPLAGEITIEGAPVRRMNRNAFARAVSAMLTERPKTDMMTCRDVVETGRYPYTGAFGLLGAADHAAVEEAMALTDTAALADRPFGELSDGQRQRVLLARAVCREPKVLLLDEPTSYLDLHYKFTFLELLDRLRRERKPAVVMSLHEPELARAISDRVLILKDGSPAGYGKPEELLGRDNLIRRFDLTDALWDKYHG